MRILAVAVVVLAVAACGSRQRTTNRDRERVDIRIEGNQNVSSSALLRGLVLPRAVATGQPADPYLVSVDQDRVRGYYLRRGYFRVEVSSAIQERAGGVEVVFRVVEGPRARLAGVEIEGLPDGVDRDDVRSLIALADGAPFDYEPYHAAKQLLVRPLERAGYARAEVEATVEADIVRDEATIRLVFEPGPECVFGTVNIRGLSGPLETAAHRRVRVHAGAPFSTTALEDTQTLLYDMKRFAVVRVAPDLSGNDSTIPILIDVVQAERHELRLGGGIGLDPESVDVHGRATYAITGWPRPLFTTTLELRPAAVLMRDEEGAQPQIEAIAAFERIDFLRVMMTGEAETALEYLQIEPFTSAGPRLRLAIRSPIATRRVLGRIGWTLRMLDFPEIDPAIDDATAARLGLDAEVYRLGYFEQSLIVDLRDNAVTPHSGLYAEVRIEEGTAAAGGAFTYLRVTPELRAYHVLGPRLVLAARARAGAFSGEVPVTQRYYGGGASSQRGFAERRLSPTASQLVDGVEETVVIGGSTLVESTVELRIVIGKVFGLTVGAVAFLDGGDVTETTDQIDLMHLHWATGTGVRVATPIGPVRLDVGYRLNRTGSGEPEPGEHFAFHLSLGEAF